MFEWIDSILAARRKDSDGKLMEIVIFVAIAVAYAVGGILKMRSKDKDKELKKVQPRSPDEQHIVATPKYGALRDSSTTPEGMRGKAKRTLPYARQAAPKRSTRRPPEKIAPPQPPPQRPQRTVRPKTEEVIKKILEPVFKPQELERRPHRQARSLRRRPAAKRAEIDQAAAAKARKDLAYAKAGKTAARKALAKPTAPAEAVPASAAFASLGHLSQPDNLKMAIVYAEILGQPLGLRDM